MEQTGKPGQGGVQIMTTPEPDGRASIQSVQQLTQGGPALFACQVLIGGAASALRKAGFQAVAADAHGLVAQLPDRGQALKLRFVGSPGRVELCWETPWGHQDFGQGALAHLGREEARKVSQWARDALELLNPAPWRTQLTSVITSELTQQGWLPPTYHAGMMPHVWDHHTFQLPPETGRRTLSIHICAGDDRRSVHVNDHSPDRRGQKEQRGFYAAQTFPKLLREGRWAAVGGEDQEARRA